MNRARVLLVLSFLLVGAAGMIVPAPGHTAVDAFEFETEEQGRRFRQLSDELRCPMCQNTSLSGSTGGVAADLRREIHRMIMEGQSDEQIEQFMFERYGDFIFYRPRLGPETILLWFGPLLFLLIGAVVIYGIMRRSRPRAEQDSELSEAERQRLDDLLKKR